MANPSRVSATTPCMSRMSWWSAHAHLPLPRVRRAHLYYSRPAPSVEERKGRRVQLLLYEGEGVRAAGEALGLQAVEGALHDGPGRSAGGWSAGG